MIIPYTCSSPCAKITYNTGNEDVHASGMAGTGSVGRGVLKTGAAAAAAMAGGRNDGT